MSRYPRSLLYSPSRGTPSASSVLIHSEVRRSSEAPTVGAICGDPILPPPKSSMAPRMTIIRYPSPADTNAGSTLAVGAQVLDEMHHNGLRVYDHSITKTLRKKTFLLANPRLSTSCNEVLARRSLCATGGSPFIATDRSSIIELISPVYQPRYNVFLSQQISE